MISSSAIRAAVAFGTIGITGFALNSSVSAAAFQLNEQSVMASGRAFAGSTAATDDAGIIAYNPAGMTEMKQGQAGIGGYIIDPHVPLDNNGSSMTVGGVGPFPLAGNQRAQGFKAQPTGYAYVGGPLTRDFALGLSVTVPFGLKNNYDSDAFSRYDSLKTKLTVIDIAPSAAFRVSDILSLGGSIIVERADATLTNALPNPLDPSGPNPASDGLLSLSADNWKVGFLVGVHVRPVEGLDIGLTYRNRMTHHLSGDADTAFAGTTATQGAKSRLALPEVYSLGLSYQLTDRVKLLAGAQYFGWDRFKEISVDLADGTTVATTEDFRNSWGASIGADVKLDQRLNLRGGLQYDKTPTRDAFRSTRMPDPNRLWAAAGLSYILSNHWAVDASYSHMFKKSTDVNRDNDFPTLATTVETRADAHPSSNVFGLGLRATF